MCCSIGKANIIYMEYADDGDGAISCPTNTWWPNANSFTCNITGDQYWGPGHVVGTIQTDSAGDPNLTLDSAINNDTSFTWTAYDVNVYMNNNFTLSADNVTVPPDWTATIIQSPVYVGSPLGAYEAQMVFTSGTPVPYGGQLDFGYTISFTGAQSYSFTQEMIPVPEPGTLGFLAAGALLLGGFLVGRWHNRHS